MIAQVVVDGLLDAGNEDRPRCSERAAHGKGPAFGNQLHSAATVKEAAQTQLCAYLSVALLLGLGANALAGWWWADPLAALAIAAVAIKEGRESWRGEGCCDAC